MSNALAIAAVTAVLKDLLNNGVIDHDLSTKVGNSVTVTALPPDRIKIGDQEAPQINLFLYHVAPNPGWRNVGLPSRDDRGERLTNPPLALDLYYLLSTYGKNDFDGEILLGYAMQMLHETPVLPRNAIRTAQGNGPLSNPAMPVTSGHLPVNALTAADLADQVEQIKIVPQALNTEEISKLWMAMQGRYRPTAAYQASVVLIESNKPTRQTRPVLEREILVQPFRRPFIEEVTPQVALKGQALTIRGRNLNADNTKLDFGVLPLADPTKIGGQTIEATLPNNLLAGVNTVRVLQQVEFRKSNGSHGGFESNVVPFMLAPQITVPQPNTVQRGKELKLTIDPPVGSAQSASLLLGDSSIATQPRPAGNPAGKLSFSIPPDFPTGTYPVRVQIDGAQSQLEIDQDKNSPTFGQYTGNPKVTVTS